MTDSAPSHPEDTALMPLLQVLADIAARVEREQAAADQRGEEDSQSEAA